MRSAAILVLVVATLGCSVQATEAPPAVKGGAADRIEGTVLETLDVASYTYVRFETPEGEVWAAVPKAGLEIGSRVVVVNAQVMSNFESKSLGRSFETIYFGTLEDQAAPAPTVKSAASPHGSQPAGTHDTSTAPIEVAKAEGAAGRTVAELYAEKDGLSGKAVALRGKVVKYSSGIMGRNWIHLQDGTGDATAGTHDVTVTSTDTTGVGEIILVEGTVTLDKDFGAGYRYAVIVEDASVK